jgi:hypothetical protein
MKQTQWGFLAGMMFMAAVIIVALWGLTPREVDTGREYGAGTLIDLRDC